MRVGIVNDMETSLIILRHIVLGELGWEVLWEAKNGEEAVTMAARMRPDILLMDLLMPGLNGAEATARIMDHSPCAVLVVTGGVDKNAPLAFEALGHGALDVIEMPGLSPASVAHFVNKARTIAKLVRAG